jgi:hypothetical protein
VSLPYYADTAKAARDYYDDLSAAEDAKADAEADAREDADRDAEYEERFGRYGWDR